MCYAYDAQPPELPGAPVSIRAATTNEPLVLTSADGTEFAAYAAHPQAANGAAIVILPDVRGLFRFYETLADRFASAGVEAIAIDYFGRTAGLTPRDDSFDFMPHVMQTKSEQVAADVAAAVAHLRQAAGQTRAIFTVGFCFGGRNSFLQAANKHGLAGVIGFYGLPGASPRFAGRSPIDLAGEFECPVLGLFGGTDQGISAEVVQQFATALTDAHVENEMVTYPNAPHSFFDRSFEQYASESADAWQRMLTFISSHTPQA